jgi:hypothetical protein
VAAAQAQARVGHRGLDLLAAGEFRLDQGIDQGLKVFFEVAQRRAGVTCQRYPETTINRSG